MRRKVFSLFLVFSAVLMMLCGCSKEKASLIIDGKTVPVDVLFSIDRENITLAEYRYYFLTLKNNVDGGYVSYWKEHPDEADPFMENVMYEIRRKYALLALANDCGIKLSATERKEIEAYKAYVKEDNGEYYGLYLSSRYLTQAVFEKIVEQDEISILVHDYFFNVSGTEKVTDKDVFDYARRNYQRYKMIYIRRDFDGTQTNKKLAESIIGMLDNGANFDTMVNTYTRDEYATSYKNGYYFSLDDECEELSFILSLEEGKYNKAPYETENGYYIFQRLPMSDGDIMPDVEQIRTIIEEEILEEKLQPYIEAQNIRIISGYYGNINFDTLK